MRAIAITHPGPPDVLQICERPDPIPGPGEVLIQVGAAGVNRPDALQRAGHYPPPPGASDLPGLEVAGTIVGGDLDGTNLRLGDSVCALLAGGGYADLCVAAASLCLPVPKGWSLVEAASLPETFFTSWSNVFDRARLAPGETLLVQGGTSGIGVATIQMARALGHRVFATAGSEAKCRACEKLGAERGINYKTEDFAESVLAATGGQGVNVILDIVGGDYVPRELGCLAEEGRLACIGWMGGTTKTTIDLSVILKKRLTLTGSTLRARPVAFKAAIAAQLHVRIWPLLESGAIRPVLDRTFPLDQASQAHALMESSGHVGKIVLETGL